MADRSSRADVRNPILGLPEFQEIDERLSPEARAALIVFCTAIHKAALPRAQKAWDTHKAPMAAYWKGTGVSFGHIARAIKHRSVEVAPGLSARDSIIAYLEVEGARRRGGIALVFKVIASNLRARLDEKEEPNNG